MRERNDKVEKDGEKMERGEAETEKKKSCKLDTKCWKGSQVCFSVFSFSIKRTKHPNLASVLVSASSAF